MGFREADNVEVSLIMQIKFNALVDLLISKGVFTQEELDNQIRLNLEEMQKEL